MGAWEGRQGMWLRRKKSQSKKKYGQGVWNSPRSSQLLSLSWFRCGSGCVCAWTRISASCHGTARGSDGSVGLCTYTAIWVLIAHTGALWNQLEIHMCLCSAAGFCQQRYSCSLCMAGAVPWTLHCGCVCGDGSAWCIWIFKRGQKRSRMDRLPIKII